jgi:hypothetical protein
MVDCLMLIRDFDYACEITFSRRAVNQHIDWLISVTPFTCHCADALTEIVTGLPFFKNVFRLLEDAHEKAHRLKCVSLRTVAALHRHGFIDMKPEWPGDVLATTDPELYASVKLIDPPLH